MDFRSPLVCNYFAVDDVLIDDTLRLNFSIILLLRCPFIVYAISFQRQFGLFKKPLASRTVTEFIANARVAVVVDTSSVSLMPYWFKMKLKFAFGRCFLFSLAGNSV